MSGVNYFSARGVLIGRQSQRLQSAKHDVFGPSICQEYNRSDVFCLSSVQEGFGSAFLEAMTAGKPIVAARAAAVPDVIRNGILVEPEIRRRSPKRSAGFIVIPVPEFSRSAGLHTVEQFKIHRVAAQFLYLRLRKMRRASKRPTNTKPRKGN